MSFNTPNRDRGEVSATTVVLAAALIALAIAVGVVITARVQDKANTINLGSTMAVVWAAIAGR